MVDAGHWVIPHEAHTSPVLHTGVCDFTHQTPPFQLRHGGFQGHFHAIDVVLYRPIGQRTQSFYFGLQSRQMEVNCLLIQQRLIKYMGSRVYSKEIIVTAYTVKRGRELVFSEVNISEENSGKLLTNGTMIYRIT